MMVLSKISIYKVQTEIFKKVLDNFYRWPISQKRFKVSFEIFPRT